VAKSSKPSPSKKPAPAKSKSAAKPAAKAAAPSKSGKPSKPPERKGPEKKPGAAGAKPTGKPAVKTATPAAKPAPLAGGKPGSGGGKVVAPTVKPGSASAPVKPGMTAPGKPSPSKATAPAATPMAAVGAGAMDEKKVPPKGITVVQNRPMRKPKPKKLEMPPSEPLLKPGNKWKPLIPSGPKAPPTGLVGAGRSPADATILSKNKLNRKDLDKYREILLRKRAELVGDITNIEDEALRQNSGSLSNVPQHMAEQGSDTSDQSISLDLAQVDRNLIRAIDEALKRIDDGTYGVCMRTGQRISAERLAEIPWAKYSIEAQRELELRPYNHAE